MGNQPQRVALAVSSILVVLGAGACSSSEAGAEVDPASTDVESWSRSVLGAGSEMSFASRHQGEEASGGSFSDVQPGWYDVTMACAGGNDMSLELLADGEILSTGTTNCDSPAVTASVELSGAADELTLRVTNSGEEMMWAVGLSPGTKPEAP